MKATEGIRGSGRGPLRFVLAVMFVFLATRLSAAPLPSNLVGVWVADGSTLNGQLLLAGEALYLRADGVGAIVGASSPIVARVIASLDSASGTVMFDILDHGKVVGQGAAIFDAATASISFGDPEHALFRRRFEEVSADTSKALGL